MKNKRKILKVAERTLAITLPQKWLRDFNLKKGDEVRIEEMYNKIIVKTETSENYYKISIDLSQIESLDEIEILLGNLYKRGYDLIKISYSSHKTANNVLKVLKHLLRNFKVKEQKEDTIILINTIKERSGMIKQGIRRSFLTTLMLAEQTLKNLKKNEDIKKLIYLEEENDHITSFTQRLLNKFSYPEFKKTNFIYYLIRDLEKICDHYASIIKILEKPQINPEISDYFQETNQLLRDCYDLFYKFNIKRIIKLKERRKRLQEKGQKLIKKHPITHYLLSVNEKVTELAGSIISLNQKFS